MTVQGGQPSRIILGSSIATDTSGFELVARLYKQLILETSKDASSKPIVDMSMLQWIDANMCAPLGAVLVRGAISFGGLSIVQPNSSRVKDIINRNGFIPTLLGTQKPRDYAGTTIEFKIFESSTQGERDFSGHANRILADRDGLSTSEGLKNHLVRNVLEIFNNSVIHSNSGAGIFACGQFYPTKHKVRLSISDLGSGILPRVSQHLKNTSLTSENAIKWAVKKGNTTKINTPGGLGLGLLHEFITINGGQMQIVSGDCLWQYQNGREHCHRLSTPLLGTSVNITINTGIGAKYSLISEEDFDFSNLF